MEISALFPVIGEDKNCIRALQQKVAKYLGKLESKDTTGDISIYISRTNNLLNEILAKKNNIEFFSSLLKAQRLMQLSRDAVMELNKQHSFSLNPIYEVKNIISIKIATMIIEFPEIRQSFTILPPVLNYDNDGNALLKLAIIHNNGENFGFHIPDGACYFAKLDNGHTLEHEFQIGLWLQAYEKIKEVERGKKKIA